MSFSNPSELFLLARICFVHLILFSVITCLVFVASTERKIGLLPSMAIHICVTTCDACATDHVARFTRPSPSAFAYCKRSKNGAGEALGARLVLLCTSHPPELEGEHRNYSSTDHHLRTKLWSSFQNGYYMQSCVTIRPMLIYMYIVLVGTETLSAITTSFK